MGKIECSVLSRSCLKQRLPDEESLCREVHALELERNEAQARINWRFSVQSLPLVTTEGGQNQTPSPPSQQLLT